MLFISLYPRRLAKKIKFQIVDVKNNPQAENVADDDLGGTKVRFRGIASTSSSVPGFSGVPVRFKSTSFDVL